MPRMTAGKRTELETFWRSHLDGWRLSDLNQREYCELHGLPLKRFGNWRAKLGHEEPAATGKLLYRRGGGLKHMSEHMLKEIPSAPSSTIPSARSGRRASVLRRSPVSVSSPRRRWSQRSAMARSSARAGSSRPGSVWCPDNTRATASLNWAASRSVGMATSGACSCMLREPCCGGAAPSRVLNPVGPTNSWRGGRQTSCWSPWPIRPPASPGQCSATSVSTNRWPPDRFKADANLRG